MGPWKSSKPKQKAEAKSQQSTADAAAEPDSAGVHDQDAGPPGTKHKERETELSTLVPKAAAGAESKKSWFGGTWPRTPKATPVTQVAKESVATASTEASAPISSAQRHVSQYRQNPLQNHLLYLSKDMSNSTRSLPLAAMTTRVNASNSSSAVAANYGCTEGKLTKGNAREEDELRHRRSDYVTNSYTDMERRDGATQSKLKISSAAILDAQDKLGGQKNSEINSGWVGWFTRSTDRSQQTPNAELQPSGEDQHSHDDTSPNTFSKGDSTEPDTLLNGRRNSDPSTGEMAHDSAPRSWLGLWGNSLSYSQSKNLEQTANESRPDRTKPVEVSSSASKGHGQVKLTSAPSSQASDPSAKPSRSYGWPFWTSDRVRSGSKGAAGEASIGNLTFAGPVLQTRPATKDLDRTKAPNTHETGQAVGLSTETLTETFQRSRETKKSAKVEISAPPARTEMNGTALVKPKQQRTNLLLPSLDLTYSTIPKPGLLLQLGHLLQPNKTSNDTKHVNLQNPPRIKRAIAIGVHGYFPAPLIRSVLGQPTGTSIRFANGAATAIERWTAQLGYSCEIEKIALEGEGKIAERLDLLWKLLLSWIEDIRNADCVMVACHSQGVPVAVMLIAKLISFGCLHGARIGVCAMAGINLGPFGDYKSRWISGSAGELFDFAQPESQVSKDYAAALNVSLRFGVRIIFTGSLDDQLVSLESSTFVGFALRLRNLGRSDHGVIRELSTPLAGSLYAGEGHSRIYDDDAVYSLALRYTLESSSIGDLPPQILKMESMVAQNPYILPFAMRGLLEEDYVKLNLQHEVTELLQQFDDWKPSSKVLKDVKFRLEGVRSRL
ncbi:MAG: hypothetical protein Q9191_001270 [Dirinaria sp. TL-2023a]